MNTGEIVVQRYPHYLLPTQRAAVAIIFRQWKAVAIVAGLIAVATVLTGFWTPKYEAQMKILVQSRRSDAVVSSSTVAPLQFPSSVSEEDLNSEVELLSGDDLLRKVVLTTQTSGSHGKSFQGPDDPAVSAATRRLAHDLRAVAMRKTHLISVKYQATDPKVATAVLRALAGAYIEKHTEVHRPTGEFSFFDQEANRFRKNLETAQQRLAAFSLERHVVSAQAERDAALQKANDFDSKAQEAQAMVAETTSRIHTLQSELNMAQPRITTSVRNSENAQLMGQLKSTLLTLQLKKTELLTKYEPTYPLVNEVDRQIAETGSAIQAEENAPARDETTDQNPGYQLLKDELAKAQAELSGYQARATAAQGIAAQYHAAALHRDEDNVVQQNLQRDAKTQEDAYLLYVQKTEEAGISDALDRRGIVNVSIAEQPFVPSTPKRSLLVSAALTLLLMCMGGFASAFVVDAMDPTFRTSEELSNYLGVPVLAALPKGSE